MTKRSEKRTIYVRVRNEANELLAEIGAHIPPQDPSAYPLPGQMGGANIVVAQPFPITGAGTYFVEMPSCQVDRGGRKSELWQ